MDGSELEQGSSQAPTFCLLSSEWAPAHLAGVNGLDESLQ